MFRKTLLLNYTYEVLSFIPERKVFKLLFKDKVEVISTWDNYIKWVSGNIQYPSILKLKNHVKRNYAALQPFTRKALIKRDKSTCQYCFKKLNPSQITIDHVLPRSQGGGTSFINCVISCHSCNNKKDNMTPEQAGMILHKKPAHPSFSSTYWMPESEEHWHPDWDNFIT